MLHDYSLHIDTLDSRKKGKNDQCDEGEDILCFGLPYISTTTVREFDSFDKCLLCAHHMLVTTASTRNLKSRIWYPCLQGADKVVKEAGKEITHHSTV